MFSQQEPVSSCSAPSAGKDRAYWLQFPMLIALFAVTSLLYAATPSGPIPASYMGLSLNSASVPFPNDSFGLQRFWDTGNVEWPYINTSSGHYDWDANNDGLDTLLAELKTNGVSVAQGFYTMSRTPNWALASQYQTGGSGSTAAQQCNYYGVGGNTTTSGAQGQCYPPADLAADGSGSDQTWINWVSAIANHVNNATYKQTHATIRYWEPWNEVERSDTLAHDSQNPSYRGTYAQVIRMTEDARCVIAGKGNVHVNGTEHASVTCASLGYPVIDSTAMIVMPSGHAETSGEYAVAQNFLYCNSTTNTICSTASQANGGNTGSDGAAAIDIVNFHIKPANISNDVAGTTDMEANITTLYGNIQTVVNAITGQGSANKLPLWNGEAGYDAESKGWGALINTDLRASFVGRFFLMNWSLGIQSVSWYNWDSADQLDDANSLPGQAYNQMYAWLVGRTMGSAGCVAGGSDGTQWTCNLTGSSGYVAEAIWDTSYGCSKTQTSGGCMSSPYVTVGSNFLSYLDLQGNSHTIPRTGQTHAHQVQLGIKPILLQNQ